jgi:hypothetical protein
MPSAISGGHARIWSKLMQSPPRDPWCHKHKKAKLKRGPYESRNGNPYYQFVCLRCERERRGRKNHRNRKSLFPGIEDPETQAFLVNAIMGVLEQMPVVQFSVPEGTQEEQLSWLEDMTELIERRPELVRRCERIKAWVFLTATKNRAILKKGPVQRFLNCLHGNGDC